jgi:hypothetical protein
MRVRVIVVSFLCCCVGAACRTAPSFSSTAPEPMVSPDTTSGLRYFLGRDVLLVDASVKYHREATWKERADLAKECEPDKVVTEWTDTEWTVAPLTVPDRSRQFRLAVTPGSSAQQSLNVTVSDVGLLTNLNYSGKDQTGDIIGNVLKGVAAVAGAFGGSFVGLEADKRPTNEACFKNRPEAKELDALIASTGQMLAKTHDDRLRILNEANQNSSDAAIRNLRARDSLLARREGMLVQDLANLRGKRASALAVYLKSKGIGGSDTVVRLRYGIDVGLLPASLPGPKRINVKTGLQHAVVKQLFDSARILIVAGDIASPLQTLTTGDRKGAFACKEKGEECARIYYRAPRQRVLEVYTPEEDEDMAPMILRERSVVPLVASTDSTYAIAFEQRRFADAGFKLGFGKQGNVTTLEQSSSAALAGATAAISNAVTGARQEFLNSLKAAQDAQTTAAAIRQSRANERLQELKNRKDLIDAEVALSGATASQELLAEKRRIDAELDLLKSQQALAGAQTDAARAAETIELRDQIERLKIQVELLRQQLELEKARAALNAAKPQ